MIVLYNCYTVLTVMYTVGWKHCKLLEWYIINASALPFIQEQYQVTEITNSKNLSEFLKIFNYSFNTVLDEKFVNDKFYEE